MAKLDPAIVAHLEWLGFVQPTGLVVSAPALVRAGAILDRRDLDGQRLLRERAQERTFDSKEGPAPWLPDFSEFARSVLGWNFSPNGYAGTTDSPILPELDVPLPEYGETLRPDFAVREPDPQNGRSPWQVLVRVLEPGEDFDRVVRGNGQLEASAHGRMERLLRQTGVPAGLLFNGRALRLLSAPRNESSGWLDFRVADMVKTDGRPICTALRLLLGESRLLSLPRPQRLAALLEDSRKFQNEVSERLAEQVLHALYELLRGFQAAHDASNGELLREPLGEHPDEVYRALLTVILRLVFLLYAEERDMLPEDETFVRYYSLAGLYDRLREDAALYPDTMDQRFGAWAQLVTLFRMVHDGAESGAMHLPRRHGVLFDPDRFKFLEGRSAGGARQTHERIEPPLVPDGTIYRAFENLLVLDGERISYRALDVEQIGSVYETMMGFRLETATGRSVAIKAQKKHGAPTAIDLEAMLREPADKREGWIVDRAERKLTDTIKRSVKEAVTLEDLHAALTPAIDLAATPDLVPQGAMVLQPSEERRRSGSHYTPRALTEPIVRTTLAPILARLRGENGRAPRPEQILDLKVCDPAMGSGAFLVEACRQLGDALIEAWRVHNETPKIPSDEREDIFAMRLVAQRCLYGVDRNPVAVDLAKVSLWLVTLARDHALTFVDHALRHGDSLVGLSRRQIEAFHWDPDAPRFQAGFETMRVREQVAKVAKLRQRIREADESVSDWERRDLWDEAQVELGKVRLFGDLVLAAFFEAEKAKDREAKRVVYANAVVNGEAGKYGGWLEECRHEERPLVPFHWELEFPEAFEREHPGFDAVVGNPPFAGVLLLHRTSHASYTKFLRQSFPKTGGKCDLVAFFFRASFAILRTGGCLGLVATNTIAQGDTRESALTWICTHDGHIYSARKRVVWPGTAAVVVSIVHIVKRVEPQTRDLNGRRVEQITAFLFHAGGHESPQRLAANRDTSFKGCDIYSSGFIFDLVDNGGSTGTLEEMESLIAADPRNAERILPYLGGEEILNSPNVTHHRYVIDLDDLSLAEAGGWPSLLKIVERRVKPQREELTTQQGAENLKEFWWRYGFSANGMRRMAKERHRFLVHPFYTSHVAFAFVPSNVILATPNSCFALSDFRSFSVLQSRIHDIWVRFVASSFKDDLRYTPTDCFETFPFPENGQAHSALEAAGKTYYEFRTALMVGQDEGLTKTYNRLDDPNERAPEIEKLRDLHAVVDRAVLDAYGWHDIKTAYEFLLDYEIDEEEWGSKKKPYRYRWPDEVRDEVLARLMELNAERAHEEARAGSTTAGKQGGRKAVVRHAPKTGEMGDLFS